MIPIGDDNPVRTKPYVTYFIIALNIAFYLVDRIGAQGSLGNLWSFSLVPRSLVTNQPVMMTMPVQVGNLIREYRFTHTGLQPQWLTIFTSMFMHGSLMHIGGNMLYLWIFGNNIEDILGHVKYAIFYLACGVCAALAHVAMNLTSTVPMVGASGAIAGVLGAYLMLFPLIRIRVLIFIFIFWDYIGVPAFIVLGVWFLTQLMGVGGSGGMQGGGVAYWAHIGGFLAGAGMVLVAGRGTLLAKTRRGDLTPYNRWN
jgi:membrane associated rhomboid family serine protease